LLSRHCRRRRSTAPARGVRPGGRVRVGDAASSGAGSRPAQARQGRQAPWVTWSRAGRFVMSGPDARDERGPRWSGSCSRHHLLGDRRHLTAEGHRLYAQALSEAIRASS
jgi:hypothetical protein